MTQETPGPECWRCPHLRESKALLAQVGSREIRGDKSLCPRLVGLQRTTPKSECLWWGGSGQGPLGSLAGSRAQALWVAGEVQVLPSSGPHLCLSEPPQHRPQAAHWPPFCGNQPRADGTRDQRSLAPGPRRGLPRLWELNPSQPSPQDSMRIRSPGSRGRHLLSSPSAPHLLWARPDGKVGQLTRSLGLGLFRGNFSEWIQQGGDPSERVHKFKSTHFFLIFL